MILPNTSPQHRWEPFAAAAAATVVVGLVGGVSAAYLQSTFAPIGVFPIAVGVVVGAATAVQLRLLSRPRRTTITLLGLASAVICAATLHYATYRIALIDTAAARQRSAQVEAVLKMEGKSTPESMTFVEFLEHSRDEGRPLRESIVRGPWLVAWWCADATLLSIAAVVTVLALSPRPASESAVATASPAPPSADRSEAAT